jgi:hypothetical protein
MSKPIDDVKSVANTLVVYLPSSQVPLADPKGPATWKDATGHGYDFSTSSSASYRFVMAPIYPGQTVSQEDAIAAIAPDVPAEWVSIALNVLSKSSKADEAALVSAFKSTGIASLRLRGAVRSHVKKNRANLALLTKVRSSTVAVVPLMQYGFPQSLLLDALAANKLDTSSVVEQGTSLSSLPFHYYYYYFLVLFILIVFHSHFSPQHR